LRRRNFFHLGIFSPGRDTIGLTIRVSFIFSRNRSLMSGENQTMNLRSTNMGRFSWLSLAVVFAASAVVYLYQTPIETTAATESNSQAGAPAGVTFNAVPASLGAIPDHVGTCQTGPFNGIREVSFSVSGLDGPVNDVELSMTFGTPHPFVGDIRALLVAPDGAARVIFARTGATTATGQGDSSDLAGPYVFRDGVSPPNGGWWQTATLLGSTTAMTAGSYRTTDSGGAGETNPQPPTSMNSAFSTVSNPNGFWILRLTDQCAGDVGSITAASLTLRISPTRSRADFDGDGKSDVSVFRPGDGNWYVNKSAEGFAAVNWGLAGDIPAPGDFDGDGREDTVIFRPSTGTWWILRSSGAVTATQFGSNGDIPVVGDYDGDSISDIAVFRPSNNFWYIRGSMFGGTLFIQFGAAGDMPVPGDYTGDGQTDLAMYRPSNGGWWISDRSTGGLTLLRFGNSTDKPVPGDYDGDNKTDRAIWRPSTGQWWILSSLNGSVTTVTFGSPGDIPVPGDYDGDERDDQAIFRNGTWWINRSTAGVTAQAFGLPGDVPIPAKYIP
jgi:hypothetical protein